MISVPRSRLAAFRLCPDRPPVFITNPQRNRRNIMGKSGDKKKNTGKNQPQKSIKEKQEAKKEKKKKKEQG